MDLQGGLWITDSYGGPSDARIMHFPAPLQTYGNANIILTASPMEARQIAMDLSGGIWVVSGTTSTGNAVQHYAPGMSSGDLPDMMLGTGVSSRTINTLSNPYGVAVDPGDKVWVTDYFNDRVLRFSPSFSSSQNADLVIGADDFTSAGGGASDTRFTRPTGIAADSAGNLWVSDFTNNRVLRFSPPFTNGMQANMVLGQPNFSASAGGTSRFALQGPNGVSIEPNGAVWVADSNNGRAVRFSPPFSVGQGADRVLGKPDFNAGFDGSATSKNTGTVISVAVAPCGLWVTDSFNRRALFFP
ncbi:NHL repeat-containing protein [Leptospira venezuelensis]|uniref:NHL repeat-containing protein n=1 Tax=Leptospira venezuelensis TaxID=1958811 RepID=UPI001F165F2B|nr:NHL repeat-containing protein [Leptospira venezuelensis]